jgi:hypothetical protein
MAARACAALLLALALAAAMLTVPAPQARAAPITITYEVRGKGNTTSLEGFAKLAAQTLADYRGWGLGGSIRFVRVSGGGQFTLWLSAARYLPTFSSGCSTRYSCRVGRNVIINETPFRQATPAWRATGASLRGYQHMVVNHEIGHWLGFGHLFCPRSGQPAPVMQQQSKGMQGCRPNAWPTASERSTLSRWRGVPILPPPPPPPPRVAAGAVVSVPVAGQGGQGIPADARAVAANITITQPLTRGHVTAYPCGTPVPPTSNLNVAAGQTAAAFTLVEPGSDGSICLRSSTSAHLIIDVSGYVPASSTYAPVGPTRLLDTRRQGGRLQAPIAVQLPAGASAGSITATVTEPASSGYLTVYPCDAQRPLASTLNFRAGQTVANMALAKAGSDGRVCLWSSATTHLIVDLVGVFPAESGFVSRPPQRLLDTRPGPAPSGITSVSLPSSAARSLNLTITGPQGSGWARAYPCGSAQPASSNINFTAGQTVANALIAAPAADGRLCIAASAPTHIIVDDSGAIGDVATVPAARLLDTRRR